MGTVNGSPAFFGSAAANVNIDQGPSISATTSAKKTACTVLRQPTRQRPGTHARVQPSWLWRPPRWVRQAFTLNETHVFSSLLVKRISPGRKPHSYHVLPQQSDGPGNRRLGVTDHDSIEVAESMRKYPDFFLSEEVTVRMPSGTELHLALRHQRTHHAENSPPPQRFYSAPDVPHRA